ncbi:MAG TPA: rod shape-determining protein MreD [bacterium]|nr:rod shape-determining protein MreD [bacterium]
MKKIRNILIIALALLLQSTIFGRFNIMGIRPDLAMLVLIFLVNSSGHVEGIIYGFIIGLIQDAYTPEFLGTNAFTMSLMAFLLDNVQERFTVENYSVKAFVAFFACMVHDLIFLMFYTKLDYSIMINLFIRESLLGAVYTSGILFIIVVVWEFTVSGGFDFVIRGLFEFRR